MTIEMARIRIQESVNKIGILNPDEARELAIAIDVLIETALDRGKHPLGWPAKESRDRRGENQE